jgi:hypothetical protein
MLRQAQHDVLVQGGMTFFLLLAFAFIVIKPAFFFAAIAFTQPVPLSSGLPHFIFPWQLTNRVAASPATAPATSALPTA